MATFAPGTPVELTSKARSALPRPPKRGTTRIIVHPKALRAGGSNHTQVASITDGVVHWIGAMGEDLLAQADGTPDDTARPAVAGCIGTGDRLWQVVQPGHLLNSTASNPLSTIYIGRRPWLVIGQTQMGHPIAVPLNEATNPKWYSPMISQASMSFTGNSKDSQVELAHAWSFSHLRPDAVLGRLEKSGIDLLLPLLTDYYRGD